MQVTPIERISIPMLAAGFLLINWFERRRPLRRRIEPRLRRQSRNFALAGIGAIAMQVAERPMALPVARFSEVHGIGILRMRELPRWIEICAALLLMDYTIYVWHILLHRVPLLWRAHLVHHVDLDLDASTALRFHFGELAASAPYRVAQILLIGVTPSTYLLWQAAFIASIMFHHSDLRLPIQWERRLARFIVTPRMHGIHHSIVPEETNSNWSSGLALWDRLHGTLRLDVHQNDVTIGVPAFRDPARLTFGRMLRLPFERLPGFPDSVWRLPDGATPTPHSPTADARNLLS
jgi:sterol desaturase/sphingolipid hydroxylase (fatty acid hydroxylase superfamily)